METNETLPIESFINRQVELTDEDIKSYFKRRYRGTFYCQMKELVCRNLKASGYTHMEIADIVYGSRDKHDLVSFNLNAKNSNISEDVKDNWRMWVLDKKYPISKKKTLSRKPRNEMEEKMSYSTGYYVENFTVYILQ